MIKMIGSNLLFCFFLIAVRIHAEENVVQPVEPVILSPGEYSSWVVKVSSPAAETISDKKGAAELVPTPPKEGENKGPLLTQVQVNKMGGKRRTVLIYSDGAKKEIWFKDNFFVFTPPNRSDVVVFSASQLIGIGSLGEGFDDFTKTDFPELSWVNLSTYQKNSTINSRKAFLFQVADFKETDVYGKSQEQKANASRARRAWIDLETGLPIRYETGYEVRDYQFAKEPSGDLPFPESFEKRLNDFLDSLPKSKNRAP